MLVATDKEITAAILVNYVCFIFHIANEPYRMIFGVIITNFTKYLLVKEPTKETMSSLNLQKDP